MGKIMNEWVSGILTEQINKKVVVYAGRFQPFHKGHYATYQNLVKQFGKDSVYIGTSDKTDNIKSPFNFKEKKEIMMKMFGIPSNKIVQIKNPYAPTEIINKFPEETTAFITVVGEKDRYRLKGKYFEPYHPDKVQSGYKDKGYVYVSPAQSNPISGTDVRNWLSKGSDSDRMDGFKKAYGKFDKNIFDLVSGKLYKVESTMERFVTHFDMSNILNEATSDATSGKSLVDDGPGAFYGNFKSYKKVGDDTAERLGWQVIDYLMNDDFVSEFDTEYPNGPGRYPVSFFPSGIAGIGAARYGAIKGKEMRNKPAFAKWAKHIKKVATVVGYSLIDFLDAEDAKTETSKVNESFINEGGAYGHMNHPFDIEMNLTFGDLKAIIKGALNGNLELAREKCVYGDAIIKTEKNGEMTLKEFVDDDVNDKVLAYDEITQKNEYKDVMAKLNNDDTNDWLEIELEDGRTIQVTPNHRIFVEGIGYVQAKDLTEDMELKIV